jgi:poly(glycerol-phosphate) alpha-glucosyltransferase
MHLKILCISSGFLPANEQGGVPFSAYSLCSEMKKLGHDVRVITTDRNGAGRIDVPLNSWVKYGGMDVFYCATQDGPYVYSSVMLDAIKKRVKWADVIISSSTLWNYAGYLAYKYTKKYKRCHLVFVRGLLDPWAFNSKWVKKRLFWYLQGRKILNGADKIIALSNSERINIIKLGVRAEIIVIPNGAPSIHQEYANGSTVNVGDEYTSQSYLLFLGRITAKKRIDQALKGFLLNHKDRPNSKFLIAGPIDPAYKREFEELLSRYPQMGVEYVGPVYGQRKHKLLSGASGFVLTSASEGMPMAVLEAMQYHLPVVVTPECNFDGIQEAEAGWVVGLEDVPGTAEAIDQIFSDSKEAARRGRCAQRYATENYNWAVITKKVLDVAGISRAKYES